MVYGYIRVSTDKQNVENQRFQIREFCRNNDLAVESWIEETVSGAMRLGKRKLSILLKDMQEGDILICSELSRLGRNLLVVMSILNLCMEKGVQVWTIRDNYRLGADISSKVLAFAFGLAAEIERNLISQRTKDALARKKAEGVHVGRPHGSKSQDMKLTGRYNLIVRMLDLNMSKAEIARRLGVHRSTLKRFIEFING